MNIPKDSQKIYAELLSNGGVTSILIPASDAMYDMEKQPVEIVTQIQNLRKCIQCIVNAKFDIRGFKLFEIPLDNIFIFYNNTEETMFDLVVDNGIVTPAYLDDNCTCKDAKSIEDAIDNYNLIS